MSKSVKPYVRACPFCGNPPETMGSGERQRGLMIHCITEGCVNPSVSYYEHDAAIRAWNRRWPGGGKNIDADARSGGLGQ